jgi:hypothetical protein
VDAAGEYRVRRLQGDEAPVQRWLDLPDVAAVG